MARVLIVEDEKILAKNFEAKLASGGHAVRVAHNGATARTASAEFLPEIILLDIRLPDSDGLKLLPKLKAECPFANVIVMTAHGNERVAVGAMKAGACEYLTKPIDLDELQIVVQRTERHQQLSDTLSFIRGQEKEESGLDHMIGESQAVRGLKETIRRFTRGEALALADPPTVLITGETGTGKDLAAQAIHYQGPRSAHPFIHVNCTALPATLFESELFGHVRGAFTSAISAKRGLFEVAHGGTIFLDEIGHLDADVQAKLLHAIENREIRAVGGTDTRSINVHIIAATNRDLEAAVEKGDFRRDLFHRLHVIHVHLPPLRDREDDVILLASHFLAHHCKRFGIPARRFSQSALDLMRGYRWRGNIRELSHTIESCLLQSAGETIEADDLRLSSGETIEQGGFAVELTNGRKIVMDFERQRPTLDEVEHAILVAAYEHTGQNLSRAARILGITREALRYRLNKGVESVQTEG